MPLKLTCQCDTTIPIEVEGITPEVVGPLTLDQIQRLPVYHGNRQVPLAELFRVSGDPGDGQIHWEGELAGVHWIGAKMQSGQVHVEGRAGRHLGSEMSGGVIEVHGDAGDWVGAEMHGGLIRVRGRAGHLVGAAYRGSAVGMTEGAILIDGPAGNEIGHSMRRGLIAVGGAGDLLGFNMRAGTILVFGSCGIRVGAGMRRGTILLSDHKDFTPLPSFRRACRYQPLVLPLICRFLADHRYTFPPELASAEVELYHGDLIEGGRGELLLAG